MKVVYVLLIVIFITDVVHAQWTNVNTGSVTNYESIYFFDSNNGIASSDANIIKTSNGGNSWTKITVTGIRDIDFVSSTIGFSAGVTSMALKKTTDGGNTWTSLTPVSSNSLWGVSAVDANTVYVCGTAGAVWKSTNGGSSFSAKNISGAGTIADIDFVSSTEGCALEQTAVWKTTNGGTNWTKTYAGVGTLFTSIYFVNALNGYAVGSNGTCIKTTDGGNTWVSLNTGSSSYLQYVYFLDVDNGIACGTGGVVIRTTDGGLTWINENTGITENLNSCILLSTSVAIASGYNGVMIKNSNLLSVHELSYDNINIYPNPTNSFLNISTFSQNAHVEVYNSNGILMMSENLFDNKLDVSNLNDGIYVIKIEDYSNMYVAKFIKN